MKEKSKSSQQMKNNADMGLSQRLEAFETLQLKDDAAEVLKQALQLANDCQQVRKYDTAIAVLNKILLSQDASQNAVVQMALGVAYWEKAQLQKALNYFEEALTLFKETHDVVGEAAILSIVGVTFWRKCDWNKALDILRSTSRKNYNADHRFISLYGAFDRGIAALQNRVRMGRELQKPLKILPPLFALCALYWVMQNEDQFRACLDESTRLAEQLGEADILRVVKDLQIMAN
ncbi:MAG: tetratricopeptide repeat protein [Nitrospinaceae bacterium]|nr:tetratricopeptide repeat protein [Nitrospinaceae bacterium]